MKNAFEYEAELRALTIRYQSDCTELVDRLTAADQRILQLESKLRHFASCADIRQVGTLAMDFVAALKPSEPGAEG